MSVKRSIFVALSILLVFSLAGCDLINQLFGSVLGITIAGTVTLDLSVQSGHRVWVGLLKTAPFSAPSNVSSWVKSVQLTISPGGSASYSFKEVTPDRYVVGAFYDLNDNGAFDQGEPSGGYPAPSGNPLYDFSSDFSMANITVSTSGGGGPATPTGLAVTNPTATSLDVSWTAVTGATSYQVYRDPASGGSFTNKVFDGSSTSFTDSGLTSSTVYWYKVQASNSSGASALSTAVSGTTTSGGTPVIIVYNDGSPGDTALAQSIKTLLTSDLTVTPGVSGTMPIFTVTLVAQSSVPTSYSAGYVLTGTPIIVTPASTIYSSIGQSENIASQGNGIIAMGTGGAQFLDVVSSNWVVWGLTGQAPYDIGWGWSWIDPTGTLYTYTVTTGNTAWTSPLTSTAIPGGTDMFVQISNTLLPNVDVYRAAMDNPVNGQLYAREDLSINHFPIVRQGRFLQFGFEGLPDKPDTGEVLFVNLVHLMISY